MDVEEVVLIRYFQFSSSESRRYLVKIPEKKRYLEGNTASFYHLCLLIAQFLGEPVSRPIFSVNLKYSRKIIKISVL